MRDDEQLRRFIAARRAGDDAGARLLWEELLVDNFDRVRAMVAIESRGRLSDDERQEALQRALVRMTTRMIDTFRGTTMGEYVEVTRKLVKFACIDTQRRAAAIAERERPLDADVYAAIEQTRLEQEDDERRAATLRQRQAFLDWAVPQLSGMRRAVFELDRQDVPIGEIERRLGASRDAVYASRSRALKDLARLRYDYEQL